MIYFQIDFDTYRKSIGGGLLTDEDLKALKGGTRRVYELMKDGKWHTRWEIEMAAGQGGQPAAEGLTRMRELRPHFTIQLLRVGDSRQWKYRVAI